MDIFLVFLFFFRMTAGTVHIYKAFPEMDIGIGVGMAIHAGHFTVAVDVLSPFLWVHEERASLAFRCNLGNIGFPMTGKAVLVIEARDLSK
jgi:hypothetical protein